jgi:hypothetical protein
MCAYGSLQGFIDLIGTSSVYYKAQKCKKQKRKRACRKKEKCIGIGIYEYDGDGGKKGGNR